MREKKRKTNWTRGWEEGWKAGVEHMRGETKISMIKLVSALKDLGML